MIPGGALVVATAVIRVLSVEKWTLPTAAGDWILFLKGDKEKIKRKYKGKFLKSILFI